MRLALLVPDGVGARNFLLGAFPEAAEAAGPLAVLHGIPETLLPPFAAHLAGETTWRALTPSGEGRVVTALRNSLGYAHMYWANTQAMRRRLARPVAATTLARRALLETARAVGRVAASPSGIAVLDQCHRRLAGRDAVVGDYRRFFEQWAPDVLFCTHQRPAEIVAPVLAAQSMGIPTATFIFSWDNLTSKGRIAAPFDHYFTWSEHMRAELLRYYPDVDPARVHVVGTPQFELYARPELCSTRETFFHEIGADPLRPLICYSGGDAGTCPDDPGHLRVLLELIRSGAIAGGARVLLRPSPVDSGERFDAVRAAFPELIYSPPLWSRVPGMAWSRVMPTAADLRLLANVARYSTLNVNTASTMTLDFALHDRPVVNIAFDATVPPPLGVPLREMYYRFEHYQPVLALGAARVADSPADLARCVNEYVEDPSRDREARRRLVELEVLQPLDGASQRIVAALGRIAEGRSAGSKPHLTPMSG